MKRPLNIIVVIIVAFFAIWFIKDQAIKTIVTVVATQVTGSPVHIDGFFLRYFESCCKDIRV